MDRVAVLMLTAVGAVICQFFREWQYVPIFRSKIREQIEAGRPYQVQGATPPAGGEAMMKPWPGEAALSNHG